MKFRFIVADDAAFLREILKNMLTSMGGICVGEASNGEEAVAAALASRPDIVVLDMVMPVRNGIETTKSLRHLMPEVKIVGCSTLDQGDLVNMAYDAGVDEYVVKPFTKEQMTIVISKLIM